MKEGLEKYFQEGPINVNEGQELPEVETQNQVEDGLQQTQEIEQELPNVQEEQVQESIEEEEILEIGDTPVVSSPTLELVTENEETVKEIAKPSVELPEGVDKLVEFINETGGTLQDYLELNKDYDSQDEKKVLSQYYKQTKPHLDKEDIDYLVNKKLAADPEELDEHEYREKRIAIKEELSKAKAHLKGNKEKFYAELKASKPAEKQEDSELVARQQENANYFKAETERVFEGFKGFSFSLGEGKPNVRYKVDDAEGLKAKQSDLNNVIGGFLDEDGKIKDAQAYHKALFAMQNADKLAQLFYEQGYAMAIEEQSKDSKNIDFDPTLKAPSSDTKLKPGQARVIENQNNSRGNVRLKYTKF